MQYVASPVRVRNVLQCLIKPGLQVDHHINSHNINLSNISQTGLCWVILTIRTSLNFCIGRHLVNMLKIYQFLLGSISDRMAALVQTGKYGDINTTYTTKMGYYVINFLSESYTPQEDTTCDRQISTSGEIVVKSQYMNYMQDYTKWC